MIEIVASIAVCARRGVQIKQIGYYRAEEKIKSMLDFSDLGLDSRAPVVLVRAWSAHGDYSYLVLPLVVEVHL